MTKEKKVYTRAQFLRLSPATQRIKIAEDVIAQLGLKTKNRMRPTPGTFCDIKIPKQLQKTLSKTDELQSLLPVLSKHCEVCARGALFLSHVRFTDNYTLVNADIDFEYSDSISVGRDPASFASSQLSEIENAFEGWGYEPHATWQQRFTSPLVRLRKICENIVRNKGMFVASDIR